MQQPDGVSIDEEPRWLRWVSRTFEIATLPVLLFYRIVEELSGEGRWYREQRASMVDGRASMTDDAFLDSLGKVQDHRLAIAIRQAFANTCGVPCESIYPTDAIATLGRMQFFGFDLVGILFHLESELDSRLPNRAIGDEFAKRRPSDVATLIEMVEELMAEVRKTA